MLKTSLLTLVTAFLFIGCTKEIPKWSGTIWAADSSDQSIKRAQDNQKIETKDPRFDDYAAISYQDLGCMYSQLIDNCVQWRSMVPECKPIAPKQVKAAIDTINALGSK